MSLPSSVQRFLDMNQWKYSKIPIQQITDAKEFVSKAMAEEIPIYVVRNWVVAHLPNLIVYIALKDFAYDGVVSAETESKYLACGLFQEPVSLLHRLIKSGKTITLSYRPVLEDPKLLTRKNVKYKELTKTLKFLVEISRRRCRVFVFLKVKEVENNGRNKNNGSDSGRS